MKLNRIRIRLIEPVFRWLFRFLNWILAASNNTVFLCENRTGSVERFGHCLPGYFLPLSYEIIRNRQALKGKELTLSPSPENFLWPGYYWREEPAMLRQFLEESFEEITFTFVTNRSKWLGRRVEGGWPGHPAGGLEKDPEKISVVRNFLAQKFGISEAHDEVVFISRGTKGNSLSDDNERGKVDEGFRRRFLENEDSVLAVLENRFQNLKVIRPGDLTLSEQIHAFYNARVIVGQHGSGLWNMLWSNNCKAIIELCAVKNHYEVAAALVGARYYDVHRIPKEKEKEVLFGGGIHVDTRALDQVLKELIRDIGDG